MPVLQARETPIGGPDPSVRRAAGFVVQVRPTMNWEDATHSCQALAYTGICVGATHDGREVPVSGDAG